MSLLDDVSIVVTPNGYKAGELYAVVPVPTEGSELVTNGDFATDSNWNKGTGITISGGSANFTGNSNANINQNAGLVTGTRYRATFTISNYVSGDIDINVGGATRQGSYAANGDYTIDVTSDSGNILYFQENSSAGGFVGSIDNVSVKEYTAADMDVTRATAATRVDEDGLVNYAEIVGSELVNCVNFDCADPAAVWNEGTGWSFSGGKAIYDGTGGTSPIAQSDVIEVGKQYKITIEVLSNEGSGSNTLFLGGTILSTGNLSVGTHTFFGSTNNTSVALTIYGRSGEVFEIGSFSVKEVTRDNVPRIDYTGGGCPHILAEPQRTNVINFSEDFTQWDKGALGGTVSEKSVTFGALNTNRIYIASVFSAGTNVSISVRFNNSDRGKSVRLGIYDGSWDYGSNILIPADGYVSRTITLGGTDSQFIAIVQASNAANSTLSLPTLLGGAQAEEGLFPTSYIKTSGSTVTRNQDQFTRDGIGSLINSTEGTFFVEMARQEGDTAAGLITLNDGTNSQTVSLYYFSTGTIYFDILSGSPNVSQGVSGIDTYSFNKIAIKYKSGDIAFWINGVEVYTSASAISLTGLNTLSFSQGNDAYPFFGKVKQLQVYDTALTDEQLLQLTGESGNDFYESYAEMASALTYTIQ